MPNQSESYWDLDFDFSSEETPRRIMTQQAGFLEKVTQGLLHGYISTRKEYLSEAVEEMIEGGDLIHDFFIVAPALDNYRYKLFEVTQPITIYPLRIENAAFEGGAMNCKNIDELKKGIAQVLNDQKTKQVIRALIIQSMDLQA